MPNETVFMRISAIMLLCASRFPSFAPRGGAVTRTSESKHRRGCESIRCRVPAVLLPRGNLAESRAVSSVISKSGT
eukprot:2221521-Prymnesium_polylepis.1